VAKKGGKFPGVSTSAYFTTGGFGYFIARNGKGPPGSADWLEPLQNVAEKHSWSKDDLFECYDMDTFGGGSEPVRRRDGARLDATRFREDPAVAGRADLILE